MNLNDWNDGWVEGRRAGIDACIATLMETPGIYINIMSPYPPLRKWVDEMDAIASLHALSGNNSAPDSASVDIDAYISSLDATGLLELHRKIIIAREQGN